MITGLSCLKQSSYVHAIRYAIQSNFTLIPVFLRPVAAAFVLMLLSLLGSCASGVGEVPPGGPADSTAPTIVSTIPAGGSVNVRSRQIKVEFSEYIQESSLQNAMIITPIPARPPEYDWSGRKLTIEFDQPLAVDRTYAITFGSAITDLSGNRLGTPFTLRFSTGEKIDSGVVRGDILGVDRRRVFVYGYLLPPSNPAFADTLQPDQTRPDFIAPVSDNGSFSLEGLPPGRLRLFAISDEFNDQLFSPGIDAFGTATRDVTIGEDYAPVGGVVIRLRPAPIDVSSPVLFSASSITATRTELRFSEPIDTATLRPANFTLSTASGTTPVVDVWRSMANRLAVQISHGPLAEDVEATISVTALRDTAGNVSADSAGRATFTATGARDTLAPTLLALAIDSVRAYSFSDSIPIAFDERVVIETLDEGTVTMRDSVRGAARFRLRRLSPVSFAAYPLDTLIGLSSATLEIDLRRFSDEAGNRRDSVARIRVAVVPIRQVGTLQGSIRDSGDAGGTYVVVAQMVTTGQCYRRTGLRNGSTWEFAALPEGEYTLSAFRDNDADGLYDYGSLTPYRPAEPYTVWRGSVRVRPRWVTNKIDLVFAE